MPPLDGSSQTKLLRVHDSARSQRSNPVRKYFYAVVCFSPGPWVLTHTVKQREDGVIILIHNLIVTYLSGAKSQVPTNYPAIEGKTGRVQTVESCRLLSGAPSSHSGPLISHEVTKGEVVLWGEQGL